MLKWFATRKNEFDTYPSRRKTKIMYAYAQTLKVGYFQKRGLVPHSNSLSTGFEGSVCGALSTCRSEYRLSILQSSSRKRHKMRHFSRKAYFALSNTNLPQFDRSHARRLLLLHYLLSAPAGVGFHRFKVKPYKITIETKYRHSLDLNT